jgi:hypothetical protein
MVIVVAPFYSLAEEYCRMADARRDTHRIVVVLDRLQGLSEKDHVVLIEAECRGDWTEHVDDVLARSRATVERVDLDTVKGIIRP